MSKKKETKIVFETDDNGKILGIAQADPNLYKNLNYTLMVTVRDLLRGMTEQKLVAVPIYLVDEGNITNDTPVRRWKQELLRTASYFDKSAYSIQSENDSQNLIHKKAFRSLLKNLEFLWT